MYRLPDRQAQKVYTAERILSGGNLANIADVQAYVNGVTLTSWWRGLTSATVVVASSQGSPRVRRGAGERWHLYLPLDRMSKYVVIHELAHVLAVTQALTPQDASGHGKHYCTWYLALVRETLGEVSYMLLRESFRANGVQFHRDPPLLSEYGEKTEEQAS